MRTAIYARVSTLDKQEVENQLAELRRFAESQTWTVVGEYIDHVTGKTADRPQFKKLLAEAAQRRFDVVLFWALDRFTREGVLPTLQHLNALSGYGVGFRSFTEPYLDSCGLFKDAVISILATIARQERLRISERVKAGLQTARAKGRRLGRPKSTVGAREVVALRSEGHTIREIASVLRVSRSFVHKTLANLAPGASAVSAA